MQNEVGNEIKHSNESLKIRSWQEIREAGELKKPIDERIDSMTMIKPFLIKEVDVLTAKRLHSYERFNAKGDWGLAIKNLLDYADSDAKSLMLYDKISKVEDDLDIVKSNLQKPKPKYKTMGVRDE